jgi:hypothetical protein
MNKDLADLMFRRVPKPARNACWTLLIWGVITAFVAGSMVGMAYNPKRADLREGKGLAFIVILAYVGVGSIAAAILVARGNRLGRLIGLTTLLPSVIAFPMGTFVTVYGLIHLFGKPMDAYLRPGAQARSGGDA